MIALVTGANRGLELETAKQLSEKGYTVIAGSKDLAKGEKGSVIDTEKFIQLSL